MLTCKITLPDLPHPIIIGKNPGFQALYLARQNEFRFFHLINTKKYFFISAVGFCPKNLAFTRKIMGLTESGGASPPGSYAYACECFITITGTAMLGTYKEHWWGWTSWPTDLVGGRTKFTSISLQLWKCGVRLPKC